MNGGVLALAFSSALYGARLSEAFLAGADWGSIVGKDFISDGFFYPTPRGLRFFPRKST